MHGNSDSSPLSVLKLGTSNFELYRDAQQPVEVHMTLQRQMKIEVSVVVPILNERENLHELYRRLTETLTGLNRACEIVFVDDGSSDGSAELCRSLVQSDSCVTLVELRRHFGKAAALQVGFQVAKGEIIVTMDGDLQDDPVEIPRFL